MNMFRNYMIMSFQALRVTSMENGSESMRYTWANEETTVRMKQISCNRWDTAIDCLSIATVGAFYPSSTVL